MSKFYGDVNYGRKVKIDPNELRALNRRIADLEAQVEALTPKPETKTVKLYFYKIFDTWAIGDFPNFKPKDSLYAIKEVTVVKGEGLEENKSKS